ncbi:helix-hairpin-helix domain-containing protein [Mycobacterium sp. URHD0025]|uniref:ComEA family DNA-binding protein n=1 Tax=Mycobacterium sp. URHD0025 TaxID=1298864 RepID=UPI0003F7AEC1|nr:helix-hairpin-helix domain-containing protein [Mycobacterium sp. URHD0025]
MALIDINTASVDELASVDGIGQVLAAAIVKHRDTHGPFLTVDGLVEVEGISARVLVRIRGQLTVSTGAGQTLDVVLERGANATTDFSGHSVDLTSSHANPDTGTAVPFAVSTPTPPNGQVTLAIPDRSTLVGAVRVRVLAPDGDVLATRVEPGTTLPQRLTIQVDPKVFGSPLPNTDPSAGKPNRLRGQVIDAAGRRPASNLQVVVWAASVADPADADFRALIVVTTDRHGFFSGPYPIGEFSAAHATVGTGEEPETAPIHLEGNEFPEHVLLVIDLPEPKDTDDDCDCHAPADAPRSPDSTELGRADGTFSSDAGAGRCVDFTKPDRTLEEYSFSYVVRTTEPAIRALTLEEPHKVPWSVVDKFLPGLLQDVVMTAPDTTKAVPAGRRVAGDADIAVRAGSTGTLPQILATDAAALPQNLAVDAGILRAITRDPATVTADRISSAVRLSLHGDLQRFLGKAVARDPGRRPLSGADPIDWDEATVHQATTIAHGHVLRFKQEYVSDGYSMGNLLYSLPMAPGQKKQIAVVDWERREVTTLEESRTSVDRIDASLVRDRDVNEIVSGTLTESTRGGSSSSTGGVGGGLGISAIVGPVGGLLGVGGGYASADSEAWQNSSRQTSANALNQLRDRTIQSASSVRSQRTSVVHTVAQGERVTATTETVANYNHCHAITIQYFEVLRHMLIRQRLVDVQECLLVPMLMSWFTRDKALRWRNTLARWVSQPLRAGFAALERIDAGYIGSDLPTGRYADENLESVEGDLSIRFQLTRPRDKDEQFDPNTWSPLLKLFGFDAADFYAQFLKEQQFKDRVFLDQMGPRIASNVASALRVFAVRADDSEIDLRLDPTLVSTFANDRQLSLSLRMTSTLAPVHRADVKAVKISARLNVPGSPLLFDVLPAGSRVIVESGSLRYRTAHLSDALFRNAFIRNDLTGFDDVRIETPLNRQELRNPREEDKELARHLLDHLNENIEVMHQRLWSSLSDARLFMLLDGFEAPNSGGRSVASVVENELIGIIGNSLVLPVARGFHLDPTFKQDVENPIDLLEHYEPNTPIEPTRIAIPTRGVYAEAVMGACNSCESMDETRFWRWEESPIPDSPTALLPVSTDTRRATPAEVKPTDLPAPIIAMQNAPAAPDPTGVGAALSLLGQAGAFKDITGLEGTQRNAAAALQQSLQTATTFGTKAADLALQAKMSKDIDKAIKTIGSAKQQGLINDAQAAGLTETAIRGMVGAGTTNPKEASTTEDVEKITKTAGGEKASVSVTRPTGEKIEVDARDKHSAEDSAKPIIILDGDTESADLRAFHPKSNDKSLVIEVAAKFRNAPADARLRWSTPKAGTVKIDNPDSPRTKVRGIVPGITDLDIELLDGGGVRIASMKLKLSVPQCVKVVESTADFDQALADAQLAGRKGVLLGHTKAVVENLLATSNTRVYWQLGGLNDALPAHVPAANVVTATIRNKDADGNLGITNGPAADTFDETIDIFPGMYTEPDAIDVDTETQALVIELQTSLVANPALTDLATKVFGRLIGETLAHEIGHALLWDDIPGDGHNRPAIAHDLMNSGVDRVFKERTGMENTRQQSPVQPADYVDHGIATIDRWQAANQALIDNQWPVPPHFG